MEWHELAGLENGKRAIEVAATGGHSILLIGPPGYGKSELLRHLPEKNVKAESWPCPCGYLGDARRGCGCDPAQIKYWYVYHLGRHAHEMTVELCAPRPDEFGTNQKREHWEEVKSRIEKACAQIQSVDSFSDDAKSLLNRAYHECTFSPRTRSQVIKVAHTIAAMDNAKTVESWHMAEAIQYAPRRWGK